MRVVPGKRKVAVEGPDGEWMEPTTVEVVAGEGIATVAAPPRTSGPSPVKARGVRRRHVSKLLGNKARLRGCMRTLEKQGLAQGSFIVFDLGVNRKGEKTYLNISSSNVPRPVERCMRDAFDELLLPPGPSAALKYRVEF
jgi:hypothetical protein